MAKKRYFCYNCENEYTVISKSEDDIEFCCFCGQSMEDSDKDDELEE